MQSSAAAWVNPAAPQGSLTSINTFHPNICQQPVLQELPGCSCRHIYSYKISPPGPLSAAARAHRPCWNQEGAEPGEDFQSQPQPSKVCLERSPALNTSLGNSTPNLICKWGFISEKSCCHQKRARLMHCCTLGSSVTAELEQ